jgi:oligopeptide transport system substrate-binding protein
VTLEDPTPFFLDLCAFVTLLPAHLPSVERWGDGWTRPGRMVSNGAYVLAGWRLNDRVSLAKNPHYWNRDGVAMGTIDVLPGARANTAFNYYATGAADLMLDKGLAPTALLDKLRERRDFHSAPFLGTYFVRFNASRKPFDDPRVRQAFARVLDRERYVAKITRAGEPPAYSFVPDGAAGYRAAMGWGRDPEAARRLLAEAGYPGGAGFPLVNYLYKGDSDMDRDLAVELQAAWRRELGVHVALQGQEWKVYLRSMSSLDYDLCRSSWVGDYLDPNTFLDMFVTGGGNNRTGWGDPEYDAWIAAAARERDGAARFDILRRAEWRLVGEACPIVPLFHYVGIQMYDRERLGGIEANLLDEHPLKEMYWKRR